ncbi:hypothetical protein ACFQLX_11360 [Streptomyces polyrhachis]|uniref:Integral membrane protein n=1 Tax=Streptomyces polyrhachis TaxID=1282885 RepID=A0ABW2GGJ3_9ACTN
MGIEGDQLILDYLSRVGDLAQQRALPSGERVRLVTRLRTRIDRVRAEEGAYSAAEVRRVLERFGSPGEIVEAAADDPASAIPEVAARPPKPTGLTALAGRLPKPRPGAGGRLPRPREEAEVPPPSTAASPPHRAGEDEIGAPSPDWWRTQPGPFGAGAGDGPLGDMMPGFTGGIEVPELLRPPEDAPAAPPARAVRKREEAEAAGPAGEGAVRPALRLLAACGPLQLLALAALLAGAVLGQPLAVGAGLLLAYGSRRLSRTEAKWAAAGIPATVGALMLVWLYGRVAGRWGAPLPEKAFGEALGDAVPWLVRAAALASAAFLLWRTHRRVVAEEAAAAAADEEG